MSIITATAPDVDRSTPEGNAEYCRWYHRKVEAVRKLGFTVKIVNPHRKCGGRKQIYKTAAEKKEARREYQYKYYRANKEKAQAYQRAYDKTHKKSTRAKVDCKGGLPRPKTRVALHPTDLMQDSTPHFERDLAGVLRGKKFIVRAR